MSAPVQVAIPGIPDGADASAYPRVDGMRVPFTWEPLEYVMSRRSPDFERVGLPQDWDWKRSDDDYQELVESIRQEGILDPVFLFSPHTMQSKDNEEEEIGNGHHRIAALFDLGYKFVPVTRNPWDRFRSSGISAV